MKSDVVHLIGFLRDLADKIEDQDVSVTAWNAQRTAVGNECFYTITVQCIPSEPRNLETPEDRLPLLETK